MRGLRISKDLLLPQEAVTQTFAILAKRGAGKTYTASVMAEELIAAKLPTVIIDPIGVWWGLRASADGKGEGLPIGLFAVGCRSPGHFEPGQGTELIAFLAHVTRYAVGRWWSLKL